MNKRIFWKKVKQQGVFTSKSGLITYTPVGSKRRPKLYQVQVGYGSTLYCFKREINKPLGNMDDWNFMDQHSSPRVDDKEMIVPMTESSKKKTSSLLSEVEKHYGDEHHDESSIDGLSLSKADTKPVKAGATKISKTISKVFQGLKGVFNHGKKASN